MKYKIEFELPDNETVLKEIETSSVKWTIWGYTGYCIAEPIKKTEKTNEKYKMVESQKMMQQFGRICTNNFGECDICDLCSLCRPTYLTWRSWLINEGIIEKRSKYRETLGELKMESISADIMKKLGIEPKEET